MITSKNPLELLAVDPVELNVVTLKAKLMLVVTKLIKEQQLTQKQAAKVTKVSQPRISNLMNGKLSKFSIDVLIEMLARLGYMMEVSCDFTLAENPISVTVKRSAL